MDIKLSLESYARLSDKVRQIINKQNWFTMYGTEWAVFLLRAAGLGLGFWAFSLTGWIFKIIGLVVMSYFYFGIGITGTHEAGHRTLAKSVTWNKIWGYFFTDFLTAQSSLWWYDRHVIVHHVYPNVPSKEPNTYIFPWLNKYLYFFGMPYFINFWLVIHSLKFLWGKWKDVAVYLALTIAGWAFNIYLFSFIVPLPLAILSSYIMRSIFAPVFVHIAIFNHIDLDFLDKKEPWLPHQTKTTRNMKKGWFLTGMGGNAFVERHVEHHIFPSLSNRMLDKIHSVVKDHVQKEGYLYIEESYSQCLSRCLRNYKDIFSHSDPAF